MMQSAKEHALVKADKSLTRSGGKITSARIFGLVTNITENRSHGERTRRRLEWRLGGSTASCCCRSARRQHDDVTSVSCRCSARWSRWCCRSRQRSRSRPRPAGAVTKQQFTAMDVSQQGRQRLREADAEGTACEPPPSFSVANPPRLAFDFHGTTNGLGRAQQTSARGSAQRVHRAGRRPYTARAQSVPRHAVRCAGRRKGSHHRAVRPFDRDAVASTSGDWSDGELRRAEGAGRRGRRKEHP